MEKISTLNLERIAKRKRGGCGSVNSGKKKFSNQNVERKYPASPFALKEMKTNWICTAYFKGRDGLGTCDTGCQWYHKEGCPCAKGSPKWDGIEEDTLFREDNRDLVWERISKECYLL